MTHRYCDEECHIPEVTFEDFSPSDIVNRFHPVHVRSMMDMVRILVKEAHHWEDYPARLPQSIYVDRNGMLIKFHAGNTVCYPGSGFGLGNITILIHQMEGMEPYKYGIATTIDNTIRGPPVAFE